MLPLSLRLIYALNNATFQASSLALLSIVNTRVAIPAEYLPAYGAISFLPYSLRPIFAWISSLLLNGTKTTEENRNRHDKLLFPAFLLASLTFVGTVYIPSGGTILCFVWGFLRGIAGAWSDFLIGMAVIEYSKLQTRFSTSKNNGVAATYEHTVSINTAQSSTAKNIGSFVASIATFAFFYKNRNLEVTVANTLLLGTAGIFLLTALVSLKFQFHVGDLLVNLTVQRHDTVVDDETSIISADEMQYMSSSFQQSSLSDRSGSESIPSDGSDVNSTASIFFSNEDSTQSNSANRRQIFEVSTLVAFQTLLAVSALQKPIIFISNQKTWISLVTCFAIILVSTVTLGYRYERQSRIDSPTPSKEEDKKLGSGSQRLPQRQLNLYFLLRYSLPIAGFLMYSYLYSVFESEPIFLQLLSVLKTAIGSVATFCYEKFLSPYCHSGWPLIFLIATLDIIMGLVALLDVWVIRTVKDKEVDGEYFVDNQLRCVVVAVGLAKYFFAELDYMPALVLSTTNVYSDDEMSSRGGYDRESPVSQADNDVGEQEAERTALSDDFVRSNVSSLDIDMNSEEGSGTEELPIESSASKMPVISAGMQYASFLSCIDFGAQIGDWITIPIVASLGITREDHWDNLDKLVMICSIFRMTRVIFLWLICPSSAPKYRVTATNRINYTNVNNGSA